MWGKSAKGTRLTLYGYELYHGPLVMGSTNKTRSRGPSARTHAQINAHDILRTDLIYCYTTTLEQREHMLGTGRFHAAWVLFDLER
jgi:hypothetical protein